MHSFDLETVSGHSVAYQVNYGDPTLPLLGGIRILYVDPHSLCSQESGSGTCLDAHQQRHG